MKIDLILKKDDKILDVNPSLFFSAVFYYFLLYIFVTPCRRCTSLLHIRSAPLSLRPPAILFAPIGQIIHHHSGCLYSTGGSLYPSVAQAALFACRHPTVVQAVCCPVRSLSLHICSLYPSVVQAAFFTCRRSAVHHQSGLLTVGLFADSYSTVVRSARCLCRLCDS